MSDKTSSTSDDEDSVLKVLLPYLVVTALAAATLVLAVIKFTGVSGHSGPTGTVVFDVIKLANAQRAIASALIKQDDKATDNAQLLLDVSKRTRSAIVKVAGPNTLVLVKQGVVSPEMRDITDDVLKELGLPLKVPTQDTMGYLTDIAPTYLSMMAQAPRPSKPAANPGESVLP